LDLLSSLPKELGKIALILAINTIFPIHISAQQIIDFPNSFTDKEKFDGDTSSFLFTTDGILSNSQITNSHIYGLILPVIPQTNTLYIEFAIELNFNPSSANYLNLIIEGDSGSHKLQIGNKNDGLTYSLNEKVIDEKYNLLNGTKTKSVLSLRIDSTITILFQDINNFNNRSSISHTSTVNTLKEIRLEIVQSGNGAIGGHKLDYLKIGRKKWDQEKPQLINYKQLDNHHLELTYNELISNLIPPNFTLDNSILTHIWNKPNQIILTIPQINSRVINKKIEFQCLDIWNNILSDSLNISLYYLDTPKFGELLITEILFDPSPEYGHLPEFEFIELKNTSNKSLDLSSLYWKHNDQIYSFDTGIILSNQVLVFGKGDWGKSWFRKQNSFPNLYANGGNIQLFNSENNLITQIKYSPEYFRKEFNDGGVSIERISHSQKDELNLDSRNGVRGSPGQAELIISELKDTKLIDYYIQHDSLILNWNRTLYSPQIIILCNGEDSVEFKFSSNRNRLSIPLAEIGALIDSLEVVFLDSDFIKIHEVIKPKKIDYSRIDFNEIHFEVDQYGDFIELVNLGKFPVILEDLDILFYNNQNRLIQVIPLINPVKLTIMPEEIIAFCKSPYKLQQHNYYWNQIALPRFKNLSKDGCLIKIQHHIWGTLDEFDYNINQYTHLDKDTHSLEKLEISLYSNHPQNWRSSIAKPTPGFINSVNNCDFKRGRNIIKCDRSKIILPNDNNIKINYNQNREIAFVSIEIYNINGKFLFQVWNLKSINKSGFFLVPLNSKFKNLPTGNYILKFEILYPNNQSEISKQRISIFNEF